ncbi:MAG: T9SS type A sorting domain-containing protein [Paludibacter sp.]
MKTKIFTLLVAFLTIFSVKMNAATVTVGTPSGTYPSISAAIVAVGTITEPLIIELTADYAQTTDDINAIAGADGNNTVTIRPQAGVTSLVVAGTGAYVWRMNACQNVTIDGRAGGTGAVVMTLRADTIVGNSITTALKNTIALKFENDASHNTVQYLNLKGATTLGNWRVGTTGAVDKATIVFGAGIATGNSYNTIDHCDLGPIHPYTGAPSTAILSAGTTGFSNTNLTISNNNIYDYYATDLNKASGTNIQVGSGVGVLLGANTSSCTISSNNFYQTTPRLLYGNANGARTGAVIIDNLTNGSGFIVKDNNIGGSQIQCGGSRYNNTIGNNTAFTAIYLSSMNAGTSAIYGNTIKNLYVAASSAIAQTYQGAGIYVNGGYVNVGVKEDGTTAAPNIIGDQSSTAVGTTNASIIFMGSSTSCAFNGILFNSLAGASVKIANNKIAGVCIILNTSAKISSFVGVNIIGNAASTCLIDNNEIGNNDTNVAPTSMSIQNYQGRGCFGIYMNSAGAAGGVLTISNNKINNMYKALDTFTPLNQTYVNGIWFNATATLFPVTINNNEIRDLVFTVNKTNDTQYYWSSGITFGGTVAGSVIRNNKIYNIEGQGGNSTSVIGINLLPASTAATTEVYDNLIYNLSSDKTHQISQFATGLTGIFCNAFTTTTTAIAPTLNVYNNMIRLGYNRAGAELSTLSSIVGIRDSMLTTGAATANYYHNTIYIGGSNVAAADTVPTFGMCFATSATNAVVRNLKNNLVVNARSNATTGSGHYAIGTASGNALTSFTASNNDYYVSGTGGVLGRFTGKADAATLAAVQGYTGDANSKSVSPIFVNATAATADLHLNQTTYPNYALNAGAVLSITKDYDNDSRGGTSPTMGADEYTGPSTSVSNPANLDINVYANDNNITVAGVNAGDEITIYSVNGQKMLQQNATGNLFTTPISKGIYLVNVQTAKGKMNIKTIVK